MGDKYLPYNKYETLQRVFHLAEDLFADKFIISTLKLTARIITYNHKQQRIFLGFSVIYLIILIQGEKHQRYLFMN